MDGLGALFAFALVVVLIPVALWLLKRSPIGVAAGGVPGLRSVQLLALSASQRIVTIEVGHGEQRRWLVLGVTPSSITTLHTMSPQDEVALPAPVGAFGDLLSRLRPPRAPGDGGAAR